MGASMAKHILKNGYPVTVFSRTKSKADPVINEGAVWANNPKEVASKSDIVITIVGFPNDVEQTILDPKLGALSGLKKGGIIIDMTTSKPSLAMQIAARAEEKGCVALDAPVSGGDVGAKNAALSIMVGGPRETFDKVLPLFQTMGKNIRYMGPTGAGQHTKMMNQILIASGMIGLVEGLLYAHRSGLDLNEAIQAVASGAAGSWSLSNYGPRIVNGDLNPGFFVKHFIKDLEIALKEAEALNLSLPGLSLAHELYTKLKDMGHQNLGTHSLILALAKMNEIKWETSTPKKIA
jgi:3-hydroxyisobutyrate dehydrogenase